MQGRADHDHTPHGNTVTRRSASSSITAVGAGSPQEVLIGSGDVVRMIMRSQDVERRFTLRIRLVISTFLLSFPVLRDSKRVYSSRQFPKK